jgi:chaperonin GroEL (HSP60 family)
MGWIICCVGPLQDINAGDGTTSVTVLAGALLNKCIQLIGKGVHPTVISDAMNLASDKAVEVSRTTCRVLARRRCIM